MDTNSDSGADDNANLDADVWVSAIYIIDYVQKG